MYDLVIRGGTVIDGTGRPGYRADVGVQNGKIAEIGQIAEGGRETIDAADLVVSPGFIDPHTHYDAQICWDRRLTCSPEHGITSLVIGNCGVGLAPCRPEHRESAIRDLVSVEGMSFDVLMEGISWDWESYPDYMRAAGQRGTAVNLGFLASLTPFRSYVMGEDATTRGARPDEAVRIASLLREAIEEGALGIATTRYTQHIGYNGRPLACRLASREEWLLYCRTLRGMGHHRNCAQPASGHAQRRRVRDAAIPGRRKRQADHLDLDVPDGRRPRILRTDTAAFCRIANP
jgi:N-acyl-D-aspartate/D-glutamate deacylase